MREALALLLLALAPASADFDNFPVKSSGLDVADAVTFYKLHSAYQVGVEDPHPMHGVLASDGGFVFVGKGIKEEGPNPDAVAFATKMKSDGEYVWTWKPANAKAKANCVVELPSNGGLIVVGFRDVGGVYKCACVRAHPTHASPEICQRVLALPQARAVEGVAGHWRPDLGGDRFRGLDRLVRYESPPPAPHPPPHCSPPIPPQARSRRSHSRPTAAPRWSAG